MLAEYYYDTGNAWKLPPGTEAPQQLSINDQYGSCRLFCVFAVRAQSCRSPHACLLDLNASAEQSDNWAEVIKYLKGHCKDDCKYMRMLLV